MKQALAEVAKVWRQRLNWSVEGERAAREKTLRELMAEQGLDENGRPLAAAVPEQKPLAPRQAAPATIFVAEFTYADSHLLTVSVVDLGSQTFRGHCQQSGKLELFALNKVRGLIKIVDSGEMLTPAEMVDRYR
ncbi:MAG: hypothetical protein NDI70_06445 [Pseudomonas sagittaria]|nr:hypothetical protein [Pseudomonas sagittaria]